MKLKLMLAVAVTVAVPLFVLPGCGTGTGAAPAAAPAAPLVVGLGIPYKTCTSSLQCSAADYAASMFASNTNLVNDSCKSGWCRAVLTGGKQCAVAGVTTPCEKSVGVAGTATCASGQWGACL